VTDGDALRRLGLQIAEVDPTFDPAHLPVQVEEESVAGLAQRKFLFRIELDAWKVSGTARVFEGRFVIDELRIEVRPPYVESWEPGEALCSTKPAVPGGGITAEVLRRIPVGRIRDSVRREVLARPGLDELGARLGFAPSDEEVVKHRDAADSVTGKVVPRGRPPIADDKYREIAEAALQLQASGVPSVRRALALKFDYSEAAIRDRVRGARRQGWLAPASPGQTRAVPGQRLLAAWNQEAAMQGIQGETSA